MSCGCQRPIFKEYLPIESLVELSGKFTIPYDLLEGTDTFLGIRVLTVVYPDFYSKRFELNDTQFQSNRVLDVGYVSFGLAEDNYFLEYPVHWTRQLLTFPNGATHGRYWFNPGCRVDIEMIVATCPDEE